MMAIPVLRAGFLSRSSGHSSVAAASYLARDRIHDERTGHTHDFSKKTDLVHSEILAPTHAPEWALNRSKLWNAVEAIEDTHSRRASAQLAQGIAIALPRELSHDENTELVRDYIQNQFVNRGMIADIAIHDDKASDGGRNPHAHVMLTLRDIGEDGFGKKNRSWNDGRKGGRKRGLDEMRDSWEKHTNRHLMTAGSSVTLSMKSYAEQGIDRQPQQHMGRNAYHMEKRTGEMTYLGVYNREVQQDNHERDYISAARSRWETGSQKIIDLNRRKHLEIERVEKQKQIQQPSIAIER